MRDYEFYQTWKPIHLHFISSYDYIKYHGKVKSISYDELIRKKEYPLIRTFASKIPLAQGKDFCIANYAADRDTFLFQGYEDARKTYVEWEKRQQSLTEYFKNDLHLIAESNTIIASIKNKEGPPKLLQLMVQNKVSKESVIILDRVFLSFIDTWVDWLKADPYLSKAVARLIKYRPFVSYKKERVITAMKEVFNV